ncbi:Alpha/Beta hydrolase protein [Schizothecium vesticola]|uniref:Alpha/Beta hydrolase protein n=1 Tax=Schizothecium vesticola TaxID=314040 RepID=A0AA40EHC3_9PEZI|nr:Alpha/Beta hydrolase protein [Schizothecium vesticola]
MPHPNNKPIIVLIPGAFHLPHHYHDVTHPLSLLGHPILSTPLTCCGPTPSSVPLDATPTTDADAIHALLLPLLDAGRSAILVAHSYGSRVATACIQGQTTAERAARGLPGGIIGAVWIAGFAFPARGKNILGGDGEMPVGGDGVVKDGLISLTEGAKGVFYSDVAAEVAEEAFRGLCKFKSHASETAVPGFVEREIAVPKMYILCEEDKAVLPDFQERMVEVGGFDRVVRLRSGHSPFLSVPGEVVEAIVGFCGEVAGV